MDIEKLFESNKKEDQLMLAVKLANRFEDLSQDTEKRLSRYLDYDRFFNGEQWFRIKDYEGHQYTSNLCEPTVLKYTALLMGEFPKIHCPRESETEITYEAPYLGKELREGLSTPEEFNRSEAKEKILRKVLYEDNDISEFSEGAQAGSEFGDTIFSIYYGSDKKVHIESLFPGYVRLKFRDNNYKTIEEGWKTRILSLNAIMEEYDFVAVPDEADASIWDTENLLQMGQYAVVKHFYNDKYEAVIINNRLVSKPKKHGLPGIPLFLVPNKRKPFRPWGISDLHNVISLQEEYNIATSDEAKIVKLFSQPKAIGTNLRQKDADVIKRAADEGWVLPLRKDATLVPFEFKGNIYPIQQRINDVLQRFYMISGLVPVFWGAVQGSIITGVGLTATASPTLQVIRSKMGSWLPVLKNMLQFTLQILEAKGGLVDDSDMTYKEVIDGNYNVKLMPESRMPRDDSIYIMNELNKMNSGVQARTTTMTKLGVDSPEDELALISYEKLHPVISPDEALKRQEAEARIMKGVAPAGAPAGQGPPPGITVPRELSEVPQPAAQPGAAGGSVNVPEQTP